MTRFSRIVHLVDFTTLRSCRELSFLEGGDSDEHVDESVIGVL
jgi:hypothetical protein